MINEKQTQSDNATQKESSQNTIYNSPILQKSGKKITTAPTTSYMSFQNYKNKVPHSRLFISSSSSFINDKIKESTFTEKEKKDYSFKVEALRKRIVALKKQQEEIDKRRQYYEQKEIEAHQIKEDKEQLRKAIAVVDKKKQKEIENKKKKVKEVKLKIKNTIEHNDKESKQQKQALYTIAKTERKQIDRKVKNYNENVTLENKKKYSQAKTAKQKAKEEEMKKLQEKEEEIKNYYVKKVENNQKETKELKNEYEELAKLEKMCYQSLKEAKKVTEEKNRIAVHTSIPSTKRKHYRSKSTTSDSSSYSSNKPFVVKKIGFSDSFYYTHRKGKGSVDTKIASPIGRQ